MQRTKQFHLNISWRHSTSNHHTVNIQVKIKAYFLSNSSSELLSAAGSSLVAICNSSSSHAIGQSRIFVQKQCKQTINSGFRAEERVSERNTFSDWLSLRWESRLNWLNSRSNKESHYRGPSCSAGKATIVAHRAQRVNDWDRCVTVLTYPLHSR